MLVVSQLEERQFESFGVVSGEQEPAAFVVESLSSRDPGGEEISLEGGSGSGGIEGGFGGGGDDGKNNHNNDKDNSGEGENRENNKKMLMSQKLTLGYAALVGGMEHFVDLSFGFPFLHELWWVQCSSSVCLAIVSA